MNEERKQALQILKIAKGQIEAAIKMIEDDRYCIDVSNQILASQSLLKKSDLLILKQHMKHCIKESFKNNNEDEKIDEVIKLLTKMIGK
ncbi:metal-sensing transcriptional repressor [Fusobacterium sp. MFO224]|uniref:metal-sensing transcriptional repressor n=1 Tax=Fusobacterium sp. MFO224 TaxID=3378070 RepID=UPI003853953F